MKSWIIGVDVGGTNTKVGVVSLQGELRLRFDFSTRRFLHQRSALIQALRDAVTAARVRARLPFSRVQAVCLGLPGLIDPPRGIVRYLPNIPGWKNVPLKRLLEKDLGLPVLMDNDVNVIALGEWRFGAGKGISDLICLTWGTGVGGGLILDGRLYRGTSFAAGEVGHMPLNEKGPECSCGGWGCLERALGNRTLLRRARRYFSQPITLEEITARARKGDRKALSFWEETGRQWGDGLTGVINLLNPQRIVIGGGLAGAYRFVFPSAEKRIRERAMSVQGRTVQFRRARLGEKAALLGAVVLAKESAA